MVVGDENIHIYLRFQMYDLRLLSKTETTIFSSIPKTGNHFFVIGGLGGKTLPLASLAFRSFLYLGCGTAKATETKNKQQIARESIFFMGIMLV